jgi:Sec7-like guanine-nucleotide exchange factor
MRRMLTVLRLHYPNPTCYLDYTVSEVILGDISLVNMRMQYDCIASFTQNLKQTETTQTFHQSEFTSKIP